MDASPGSERRTRQQRGMGDAHLHFNAKHHLHLCISTSNCGWKDLIRKIEEVYCGDGMLDRRVSLFLSTFASPRVIGSGQEMMFEAPRQFSFDLSKHENGDLGMEMDS